MKILMLMYILSTLINIGPLQFTSVHEVEVNSSWKELTDTATIQLPQNLKWENNSLRELLKVGDPVEIRHGYHGHELQLLFTGYITGIKPGVPIEITCQDEMWQIKQKTITDNMANATVEDVLNKHFSYPVKALPVSLGSNFVIDKESGGKLLKRLKDEFGIHCFFRQGTLYAGRIYDTEFANSEAPVFQFEHNIKPDDDLHYMRKGDVKLSVTAISNNSDGSKTEVELGDAEGDKRTLNFYDLSQNELQKAAERELERLRYDGFRGSFSAFAVPYARHGDIVEIKDQKYGDRKGRYWVDAVKYTFGLGGSNQQITLGPKA